MRYSNLLAFEKHLESAAPNHLAKVYLVMAKDPQVRRQAVDSLLSVYFRGGQPTELSRRSYDADKAPIEAVMAELETISLFAPKRLVALYNVDAYDKSALSRLEAYILAPNQAICLIATASSLHRSTAFYKKMEKEGIILDAVEEKPWEKEKAAAEWLCHEAAKVRKNMTPAVAQALVKQVGADRGVLSTELNKLVCYIGERSSISNQDVSAICSVATSDTVWQFGDAIFARNAAQALRIGKGLLEEGTNLIALLRQIRSQFQSGLHVASILSSGGSSAEVAQEFPQLRGHILDRRIRQAQEYGLSPLCEGLLHIDEAELQVKNSNAEPEFILERLLCRLTTHEQARK